MVFREPPEMSQESLSTACCDNKRRDEEGREKKKTEEKEGNKERELHDFFYRFLRSGHFGNY